MNNSTFVLKILLALGLFGFSAQTQSLEQRTPMMLQNLVSPDEFLTYPTDWVPKNKIVILYVDADCRPCLQSLPEMHSTASEILKRDVRWLFVVNHKTWSMASTEVEKILTSSIRLRDFYHDPGGRFRSFFKAAGHTAVLSFRGESMVATKVQRPEDLRGSLVRIKSSFALEGQAQ